MGWFGGKADDSSRSSDELRQESAQQGWRARSKDPAVRADAHGRQDEIDEELERRGEPGYDPDDPHTW